MANFRHSILSHLFTVLFNIILLVRPLLVGTAPAELHTCALDGIDVSSMNIFDRPCEVLWPKRAPIYCYGKIIEAVNYHVVLFGSDSKHFVDRPLKNEPEKVVEAFKSMFGITNDWGAFNVSTMNAAQVAQLRTFVRQNFGQAENVLQKHTPVDWVENPPKFERIKDPEFKKWAKELNNLWKELGRKMPPELEHDRKHSLIYVPNPFVVPGGRFREYYYWDTYWIVRGLLASGMTHSVKLICQNFAHVINHLGFMPNGGRIYYSKRSQPPFFTSMVYDYYAATSDIEFLKKMLPVLEKELKFWMTNRSVDVEVKGQSVKLCRYRADSNVPRPEAFCKDVQLVKDIKDPAKKAQVWRERASGAESGWDFSSRWIKEDTADPKDAWKHINLRTTDIVPVDLNALICGNLEKLAHMSLLLSGDHDKSKEYLQKSAEYHKKYQQFREAFFTVFKSDDGTYNDHLQGNGQKGPKAFYASTMMPLFTGCHGTVDVESAEQMLNTLETMNKNNGFLNHPFGIPTSSLNTSRQWDFPNIWPPLSHMMIEAFSRSGSKIMRDKAIGWAQQWLSANHKLYRSCQNNMWMKMVADTGLPGGKADFHAQLGFGWTNGAVLDLLVKYGDKVTLQKMPDVKCSKSKTEKPSEPNEFPPPD